MSETLSGHTILTNVVRFKIWKLLEDGNLFNPIKDGHLDDELHLAQMVSLMGPPPKQFLRRSDQCLKYWDVEGMSTSAHKSVCLPADFNVMERQLDCWNSNSQPNSRITRDTSVRQRQRAANRAYPQNFEVAPRRSALSPRPLRR